MTYDHIINLLTIVTAKNRYDEPVEAVTRKPVYAYVKSIGLNEKYQARAAGLEPTIKFIMAECLEYNGEKDIEYDGERYRVSSTYLDPKTGGIELTCVHAINLGDDE